MTAGSNATPLVVPTVQKWTGGTGSWSLTSASRIVVDKQYATQLTPVATTLAADLTSITGLNVPVVADTMVNPSDIVLSLTVCNTQASTAIGQEGNTLYAQNGGLSLRAVTPQGVFYATRTLLQLLMLDSNAANAHRNVESGYSVDYPNHPFRSIMLDVGRLFLTKEFVEDYMRFCSFYKINTLHLHLNDEALDASGTAHGAFRLISPSHPELLPPDGDPKGTTGDEMHGYTQTDWAEMETVAAKYGIEIEPEIDAPGHSAAFLVKGARPDLGVAGDPLNLDTSNANTLPYIEGIWSTFLPWFQSKDIMIGGDEAVPDVNTEGAYLASLANFITATKNPKGVPRTAGIWNDGYSSVNDIAPLTALNKSLIIHLWYGSEPNFIASGFQNIINSQGGYIVPTNNTTTNASAAASMYSKWTVDNKTIGGQESLWNDNAVLDSLTQDGDNMAFKDMVPAVGQVLWAGQATNSSGSVVPYYTLGAALPTLGYGPGMTQLAGTLSAAPIPFTTVAYEADAPANKASGGAIPQACPNCADGERIGYMGSLTINNISVPSDGTYAVNIGYGNGAGKTLTAFVSFDGAAPVSVSFPSTGAYGTIQAVTVIGAFKQGSTNSLTIEPDNSGGLPPDISGLATPVLQH